MRAHRAILCVGLLSFGGLACSRGAPTTTGAESAAPPATATATASAAVKGCGLTLIGHIIAETSRPGNEGSSSTECRFASDEPVAEVAGKLASEHPDWQEGPRDGEARVWTAVKNAESVRVIIAPASDAVRARYPSARAEVRVESTRVPQCPPCAPGVWPPPGCSPCP